MHDEVSITQPVLVMMPYLGGSVREWQQVCSILNPGMRSAGIDMPGFGDAAETPGYSVTEMAQYLIAKVCEMGLTNYVLVGHSMSGKVAMVAASLMEREPRIATRPAGIVLVASSPLSPEPMAEARRQRMICDLGKPGENYRHHAEAFVRANCADDLPAEVFHAAVGDVLRMNCSAWTAWLNGGSKEDFSQQARSLTTPALIVAGEKDKDLGVDAQKKLLLPCFKTAEIKVIDGAAHLLPIESPQKLAHLIRTFVLSLKGREGASL